MAIRASHLFFAGAMMFTAPAIASERPSFDCSKAASASEKAICANARLKRLDRGIAAVYRVLRSDPGLQDVLTKEQGDFLQKRDACGADVACLTREMESRRAALALEPLRGSTDERERFVGRYRNDMGDMMVRRTLAGEYELSGATTEPNGRWTCDVWGTLQPVSKGVAVAKGEDGNDKESLLVYLKLEGSTLVLIEDIDKPLAGRSCGHNGSVEGKFRRTSRAR
jgi:uncharacterized protein